MSRRVTELQLCQGPDVIATLDIEDDVWIVNSDDRWEPTPAEVEQLERLITGDNTGYTVFRGVEYEDVVVVAVRG